MLAPQPRIAHAFFVLHGQYGDVGRYAQQRRVCRPWLYREANWVQQLLRQRQEQLHQLRPRGRALEQRPTKLERRLARSVLIDANKQAELARVGQARGVTLRDCQELLVVLIVGPVMSLARLGRRTPAASKKAGPLLEVPDELMQQPVRAKRGG